MASSEKKPASRKPCDQCTRRKVRCDAVESGAVCNRCIDAGLECTYSIERRKRGPRKGRGVVLDTLRTSGAAASSQPASLYSPSIASQHHLSSPLSGDGFSTAFGPTPGTVPTSAGQPAMQQHTPLALDDFLTFDEFAQHILSNENHFMESPGAVLPPAPRRETFDSSVTGLLGATPQTADASIFPLSDELKTFEVTPVVEHSIKLFFVHMFPTYPLLSKDTVSRWLETPSLLSRSQQTLIWSICAMTLAIVDDWANLGYEQRALSARTFIRRCRQARLDWDYMESATLEDMLASLFIANTCFDLKQRKASWVYVREAINLAISAGLHLDSSYDGLDHETAVRRRRTYGLLYITERGAAIQDNFPVSILLPPPIPEVSLDGEDPTIAHGLGALHGLFSLLDFKFVKLWNDPGSFASSGYSDLLLLQSHLRELRIEQTGLSDVQRADSLITQQWLRLVFWQQALRQGYISTTADDPAFMYSYPIEVAMDMCQVIKNLPPAAIQAHGLGIFEKQFEVAYSLMDALALSGPSLPEHHECLRYLLLSLSASPNSRQLYVRTLESKISSQNKYRRLTGVELLRDDRGSRQNSRRQSRVVAHET